MLTGKMAVVKQKNRRDRMVIKELSKEKNLLVQNKNIMTDIEQIESLEHNRQQFAKKQKRVQARLAFTNKVLELFENQPNYLDKLRKFNKLPKAGKSRFQAQQKNSDLQSFF